MELGQRVTFKKVLRFFYQSIKLVPPGTELDGRQY